MAPQSSRSVRKREDPPCWNYLPRISNRFIDEKDMHMLHSSSQSSDDNTMRHNRKAASRSGSRTMVCSEKPCKALKEKMLSRAFSEELESLLKANRLLFDPRGSIIHRWNKIFLAVCLASLFVDPLFFFLPSTQHMECIQTKAPQEFPLTVIRSILDLFCAIQIFFRFRTAFVAPSSRVFGRGELVINPSRIALKYLLGGFWLDLVAALPLPQFVIWCVVPIMKDSATANTKNLLRFSIIFQYIPRLFLIFPLTRQIVMTTGVMTETAWAGAAYNLLLYMLASHVLGASWYLLSIERQESCWKEICLLDGRSCPSHYFECRSDRSSRNTWYKITNMTNLCNPNSNFYQFGIYGDALNANLTSLPFINKYFYSFWWGLKNLSCLGQNLSTTTYVGEILFAIVIAVLGLVLFGLIIGNMQSYLQSTMVRLEEWRTKRTDTERWMHHRQLPPHLQRCVRRYHQYRWVATQGVDEEALLKDLPVDLRREIKRHLCLDLVRGVPLFDEMDERMLEVICERLQPALFTRGTRLVRELDPVDGMLFIIRGYLDSFTTQGGRAGFFDSCRIGPGEFCGEELLTWALDPRPGVPLPRSTRTVKAVSEVEAFALVADDLKFVASQFRRLHSRQLRHKFRFYSHQWRTWAACFIQAAWRRQKRRRVSMELRLMENGNAGGGSIPAMHRPSQGSIFPAPVFGGRMKSSRRNDQRMENAVVKKLKKPTEPDFSLEDKS